MASFLEKATSALSEAKESVTTTAESVGASLTDAQKTVADSIETSRSSLTEAQKTVAGSIETSRSSLTEAEKTVAATAENVKTEAAAAPDAMTVQAREAVDKALSSGIEGAKNLLHIFEEKRTEVSSKLVGAVTNAVSGASSSTSRDLPVSTDNQPLLGGVETTPWWKNCCGILDILKTSTTTTTKDEKAKEQI